MDLVVMREKFSSESRGTLFGNGFNLRCPRSFALLQLGGLVCARQGHLFINAVDSSQRVRSGKEVKPLEDGLAEVMAAAFLRRSPEISDASGSTGRVAASFA